MGNRTQPAARLTPRDVAKFTVLVALFAIFWDAAVGHGLTWENDPYWTYWVTKTFLIATIFGLGTAWFGVGVGVGAAITVVHTAVLTVYYWTFSPIGLPSSPDWLDLEHTWGTGLPIHFGVIYLGYLSALWLWRRRVVAAAPDADSARLSLEALVAGIAIVVVAGLLSAAALQELPGFTWFLVRVLITVPFLFGWWSVAGRDREAAVVGGVVLAFIWATYSQFLAPLGLPDAPLRILSQGPPPATVRWLDYRELWLISLPIYVVVTVGILLVASARGGGARVAARTAAAALVVPAVLLTTGLTVSPASRGQTAHVRASGQSLLEVGPAYSNQLTAATGTIAITATDMGDRVSPLPPHDRLLIDATLQGGGHTYTVRVGNPMVDDPMGRHTTWWGVGFDVDHHGASGIGTSRLPTIHSAVAAFGLGDVTVDGQLVAAGAPVHIMTAEKGLAQGSKLELDVAGDGLSLPGVPNGHVRMLWPAFQSDFSRGPAVARYIGGSLTLLVLLGLALALTRRPG
ncbi:MAG: hypothetical protein ABR518_06505 [Actinomycetota bacterium]